jgi:hypothetical protein
MGQKQKKVDQLISNDGGELYTSMLHELDEVKTDKVLLMKVLKFLRCERAPEGDKIQINVPLDNQARSWEEESFFLPV